MEKVKNNRGFTVLIDFAHTPNALKSVLSSLRSQRNYKKIIAVFGCAGERDIGKRQMMGRISTKIADISIFTAEDPRNEDVNEIINEIEKGALKNVKPNKYFKILDREKAIFFAINSLAKKEDCVVMCGKGHEKSMAFGKIEYPWSDKEVAKRALKSDLKL